MLQQCQPTVRRCGEWAKLGGVRGESGLQGVQYLLLSHPEYPPEPGGVFACSNTGAELRRPIDQLLSLWGKIPKRPPVASGRARTQQLLFLCHRSPGHCQAQDCQDPELYYVTFQSRSNSLSSFVCDSNTDLQNLM